MPGVRGRRRPRVSLATRGVAGPIEAGGRWSTTIPRPTAVGPDGLSGALQPTAGGEATFTSEVTFTGETAFQETGTITFGDGHRLHFETVGGGFLGASPDPALKHGTVMWRVAGGEGPFAGASGLITSNFFVGPNLEITDHHFGVLFLP